MYIRTKLNRPNQALQRRLQERHAPELKRWLAKVEHVPVPNPMDNLGDYDCPYCMQTSLKAGASRCPLCRGEIVADYWNAVRAREEAAAERRTEALRTAARRTRVMEEKAAAEQVRTAPERSAAAVEAQRRRRDAVSRRNAWTGAEVGATIGGIAIGFAGCVSCLDNGPHLHTLMPPFNLFSGLLFGAIVGALIGIFLGLAMGQKAD